MNIEQLPGVGPQLAAKIRAKFKEDAAFFAAAESQDLQAIASVDGITERRAVDLVLAARGDHTPDQFLATPAARKVRDRIMDRLLSYASTEVGRNRLRLLHPLPSPEAATAHIEEVMAAKAQVQGMDAPSARRHLRRIRAPSTPTPSPIPGMLIVAESDAVHGQLHAAGIGRWAPMGSARDLQDAADYDVVVVAYDEGTIDTASFPNAIDVAASEGLAMLCPEAVIRRFSSERATIEACAALAHLTGRSSVAPQVVELLDKSTSLGVDPQAIHDAVAAVKQDADAQLAKDVADESLAGPELLSAIASGSLPTGLQAVMDRILGDARHALHARTSIRFQPFTAGFPLGIDDEEVDRVIDGLQTDHAIDRFQQSQRTARALQALETDLWDEVRAWLEFDATFALGRFAIDHDLHAPTFGDRLRFTDSIHLDLAPLKRVQRIRYHVGDDASVAVLTGANSGGKSTLLEHLTQLVVMARMGLPTVGPDVEVPWLDEVHLVTAKRGMDAGAFETFLRGFLPVTDGQAKRLVLADEVEAVTELDAAGRILAWALDRLVATESLAVVVTHLADQVLQHVNTDAVRVDGIEAKGLTENHELEVDRCPVIGRSARSTPELIIQRLAATTKGTEQALYTDLLRAFDTSHA